MKKFIRLETPPDEEDYYATTAFINVDYVQEISFHRCGDEEYVEIYIDGKSDAKRVDVRHDSEWALALIRWLEENRCDRGAN